jgi:hypothetical protein
MKPSMKFRVAVFDSRNSRLQNIDRELGILRVEVCYPIQQASLLKFMHP